MPFETSLVQCHGGSLEHPATYADLEALPPNIKGEILDGVLYTQPRPRPLHQCIVGAVQDELYGPFHRARRGPGGWWIVPEPGIELPGSPEFSPDIAGWRRSRLPSIPLEGAFTVVPDWCCEILSPSNRGYDLVIKRRFYARHGVTYLWYVDPLSCVLTASRLEHGRWLELGVYGEVEQPRVEPFEEVELTLREWWSFTKLCALVEGDYEV